MIQTITDKWLNAEVQDPMSGLKGTVAALVYHMSGTIQATIQPKNPKGDKILDGWSIDIEVLKVTKKPPKLKTVMVDTPIMLGDVCKDTVTGFLGTATCWQRCHNGCVTIILEPPIDKDGKLDKMRAFDSTRLELTAKSKKKAGRTEDRPGAGCLPQKAMR